MADVLLTMEQLLADSPAIITPEEGTLIDGSVITVYRNRVLVDLGGAATGVISGKEAHDSQNTLKDLKPGDQVTVFVLEAENDEGLTVLSLRKASQQKTWERYIHAYENQEIIKVRVLEANKGGLLIETDSIKGFIPVSQLAPMNYPRVTNADNAKIFAKLQKLVGQELETRIINIDNDTGKLILSEKAAYREQRNKALLDVKVGDTVKGKISGVVNFGIFVTFNSLEGLVHISEIAWGHVKDPSDYGKLGDEVDVKIIGIESEKISLSIKQLTEDPWKQIAANYKEGDIIEGVVSRVEDFGAFVQIQDDINGLIHISDFTDEEGAKIADYVSTGDKVKAKVIIVDTDNRRIGLSTMEVTRQDGTVFVAPEKKSTESKEKVEESELEKLGLTAKQIAAFEEAGYKDKEAILAADDETLLAIEGIGQAAIKKVRG